MKKALIVLLCGLMLGAFAVTHAKLPPSPPKTDADKKAEADKAAATKTKDAESLGKAQDRAVANYKKRSTASMSGKKK